MTLQSIMSERHQAGLSVAVRLNVARFSHLRVTALFATSERSSTRQPRAWPVHALEYFSGQDNTRCSPLRMWLSARIVLVQQRLPLLNSSGVIFVLSYITPVSGILS